MKKMLIYLGLILFSLLASIESYSQVTMKQAVDSGLVEIGGLLYWDDESLRMRNNTSYFEVDKNSFSFYARNTSYKNPPIPVLIANGDSIKIILDGWYHVFGGPPIKVKPVNFVWNDTTRMNTDVNIDSIEIFDIVDDPFKLDTLKLDYNQSFYLSWDKSPEIDLDYYSYGYSVFKEPIYQFYNVDTNVVEIIDFSVNGRYVFEVTATDTAGNKSDPSDPYEAVIIRAASDTTAPQRARRLKASPGKYYIEIK